MRRIPPVLLVLSSLLFASRLAAQDADVLTGRVVSTDGQPVVGARVEVFSVETEITRSTLTNQDGRYMILFPDGGGRYILRVTFLGMADVVRVVAREAGEELLVTDVVMEPQAIALRSIEVRAPPPPPSSGQSGEQSVALTQAMLERLPLPDLDPNTVALLAAGVIATDVDSLSGRLGFSVAGMSDLLNQITLDGTVLRDGELGVPEAGVRLTQVTTSSFDVSRGGFAGGQVSMTTARGTNRPGGSFSYRLADDALQANALPTTNAFTHHNLGGSWGGPLIRNQLFYNVSFQLSRRVNHRFALAANDPLAVQRSGVSVDSIARFLTILDGYGIPSLGQTGPYDHVRDDIRLQARIDWNLMQRRNQSHTLALRVNANLVDEDSTRISPLDLAQHGGDSESNNRLVALSLNSRLGTAWTNTLRISAGESWRETLPFVEMPEGRVRVTSDFEDGTRGTRTLVFGGNRSMPSDGRSRDFQIADELSLILPVGSHVHRLKVGGSLQRSRDVNRSLNDFLGAFTFGSLADLEANRPERYERALAPRETRTGRMDVGLYVGDTWRISSPLELTFGLRWDRWSLDERPAYNPAVEEAFGRRTDIAPRMSALSPRLGFNYRLSEPGAPPKALTGGIGVFAGAAPTSIFSAAVRQTGLPGAEQRLVCVGSAVPIPDWDLYASDPSTIPTTCADGGPGEPPGLSQRAPNVLVVAPGQSAPSSLRFQLGYRTPLPFGLAGEFNYTYSLGRGLWGYRDLNLDESRFFMLGNEGRPFFGDPSAIVTETGAVTSATSRRFSEFGHVYEVVSDRRSVAHQLTAQASGFIGDRLQLRLGYTLGFARDQGSGSFASTPVAGNPNRVEWGTSNNDRRHSLTLTAAYAFTPEFELTAMARISSGSPFTPLVSRDINGDGARNDRAFVFDPRNAPDTAIANGMTRLLRNVPDRIRECLESQFGTIAERNSCRNGWTESLNLRASLRPALPMLGRRFTLSLDAQNVLTGLDQLIHGRNGMKGWGEGRRADVTLLEVRGFDPVTQSFIYEVNEGFGQVRRGPGAFRNAFSVTLSAQLAVGGMPGVTDRGFGRGRFGGGGFRPGGGGGGWRGAGPGGAGEGGGMPAFNAVMLLDRMLANPIPVLLELKDSLGLTAEQVSALQELSAALQDTLNQKREELGRRLDGLSGPEQGRAFAAMRSDLEAARRSITEALEAAQKILTPEQWQRVPEEVRDPFRRRPGGPPQRQQRER